jgi:hypothetical protein
MRREVASLSLDSGGWHGGGISLQGDSINADCESFVGLLLDRVPNSGSGSGSNGKGRIFAETQRSRHNAWIWIVSGLSGFAGRRR